jgi:signal transduction histidine kinase
VNAQEEERKRVAADIHDDAVQVMTAMGMRLHGFRKRLGGDDLQALSNLEGTVATAIDRLRSLMVNLRPPTLDRQGLGPALHDALERMKQETGVSYHLNNKLRAEPAGDTRVVLYRIAQEALSNVRKHAKAKHVEVQLEDRNGGVFVGIRDDGSGFDPETAAGSAQGHLGLTSMRERAEMVGGWCRVETSPQRGAAVQFWVPADDTPRSDTTAP